MGARGPIRSLVCELRPPSFKMNPLPRPHHFVHLHGPRDQQPGAHGAAGAILPSKVVLFLPRHVLHLVTLALLIAQITRLSSYLCPDQSS